MNPHPHGSQSSSLPLSHGVNSQILCNFFVSQSIVLLLTFFFLINHLNMQRLFLAYQLVPKQAEGGIWSVDWRLSVPDPDPWFSTGAGAPQHPRPCYQGAYGSVQRRFGWSQLGKCYRHLAGSQGLCSASLRPRRPPNRKLSDPNVSCAVAEKSRSK